MSKELILNNTDVKALWMNPDVEGITVTTEEKAFDLKPCEILDHSDSRGWDGRTSHNNIVDNFYWEGVVDFGMKQIITRVTHEFESAEYDKVTGVIVWWKNDNNTKTFINKNCTKQITILDSVGY